MERDRLALVVREVLTTYDQDAWYEGFESRLIVTAEDVLLVRIGPADHPQRYDHVFHVVLRGERLWIELDNSYDMVRRLVAAGVPRTQIVLGDRLEEQLDSGERADYGSP